MQNLTRSNRASVDLDYKLQQADTRNSSFLATKKLKTTVFPEFNRYQLPPLIQKPKKILTAIRLS